MTCRTSSFVNPFINWLGEVCCLPDTSVGVYKQLSTIVEGDLFTSVIFGPRVDKRDLKKKIKYCLRIVLDVNIDAISH